MSDSRPDQPDTDDEKGKGAEAGGQAPMPATGVGSDKPDIGHVTGAEQAAENRENDPPA